MVFAEDCIGDAAHAIGRTRGADDDWQMFGHYIRNNIGIAFQCFATGLLAGLGSLFFLVINGVMIGAVAGYLTARGLATTSGPSWPRTAPSSSRPSSSPVRPA